MNSDEVEMVKRIAVDVIEEITHAPTSWVEARAEWLENRWLNRAFGDVSSDDPFADLSREACLHVVRVVRSARRMRERELSGMRACGRPLAARE